MTFLPRWASSVIKEIKSWETRLQQIDRLVAEGIIGLDGDQMVWTLTDGRTHREHKWQMDSWRKRVQRVSKEAQERLVAKDQDWFFWLEEYSGMRIETFMEDFDEQYTKAIDSGRETQQAHKSLSASGAHAKKQLGRAKREMVLRLDAAGKPAPVSERHLRRLKRGK